MFMDINTEFIKKYISFISKETACTIIIYDNCRILRNSGDFEDVPEISRWHTNEYCMRIKDTAGLHRRCVNLKKHFDEKVEKSNGACSVTCYCGVTEIAVPVNICGTNVLTVSAAGIMGKLSDKMKDILCKRTALTGEEFDNLRKDALMTDIEEEKIKIHLETLACMLKVYLEQKVDTNIFTEKNRPDSETVKYINKASDFIDRYFTEDIKVIDVAKACNLSVSHLQHIFTESTGKGIGDKIRMNRLQYACQLLRTTNRTIKDIAIRSGFKNVDYFSYAFHKKFGITPLKYRKRHLL